MVFEDALYVTYAPISSRAFPADHNTGGSAGTERPSATAF
jgi:hypothetical protein